MKPLISILTPVYNQEKFIGETIESVINQTYQNWEMLVVDDCSTDSSWEVIKKFTQKDERIKIFRNEENIGLIKNWEFLIDQSRGEYIAFLEGDDVFLPENLARKIEILEKFPEVRMVYSNFSVVDDSGKIIIKNYHDKLKIKSYKNEKIDPAGYLYSKRIPFYSYSQIMIEKNILSISGYPRSLDPKEKMFLPSDWDFNFRVSTKFKVYFIDQILLKYRKHPGGSSTVVPNVCEQILIVLDNYEKEFQNEKRVRKAIDYMRGKTYYFNAVYYLENGFKKKTWKIFFIYIKKYPNNLFRDFSMNFLLMVRLILPNRINRYLKHLYFSG